jgi:hypothetical protein
MQSLLGHGEANGISPFLCALGRDHAEWKTRDAVREMRLIVQRSDARRLIWFAGEWHRQEAGAALFLKCVSQFHSSLARSLLRGLCVALRHCAVLLSGLLSQSKSGPLLQNARLGAWESRPLA